MATLAPLMTSASDRWFTPVDLEREIRAYFGGDYHDPCPARLPGAAIESGLWQSWAGLRVFCNPPYGRAIAPWCVKMATEPVDALIALVPARVDTRWWRMLTDTADLVCMVSGRLKFSGAPNSAPFPVALVYRGASPDTFLAAFRHRGQMYKRVM